MNKQYQFRLLVVTVFYMSMTLMNAAAEEDYGEQRQQMVSEIRDTVRYTSQYIKKKSLDRKVMAVMAKVPRHLYMDKGMRRYAYENRPLPIGAGQTISQPYIVALMTDLAAVGKDSIVLEIGTGSGYQAAVLAEIVKHVYTIEIIEELGTRAEMTLKEQGYRNVSVRVGDGYHGWPSRAPFDAILVTAAPETIPQPLIDQLKPGGRLVIPVGPQRSTQSLKVIEKTETGDIIEQDVLPVGFVPLTRDRE